MDAVSAKVHYLAVINGNAVLAKACVGLFGINVVFSLGRVAKAAFLILPPNVDTMAALSKPLAEKLKLIW